MPRDTFILTQDIKDDQLVDTHPKPNTNLRKLVEKNVQEFFFVQSVVVPGMATSVRLDGELIAKSPAVGSGRGVLTSGRHAIFSAGTLDGVPDGFSKDVVGELTHTPSVAFSINMNFGTPTGTMIGGPDVQIGDLVQIASPVPFTATVIGKVPNGPDFDLTFSASFFGGPTGLYTGTRVARWLLEFKDSTNAAFAMPASSIDVGIVERVYMADVLETFSLGLHPELIPQGPGGGGGGGGDIKSDGTVPFAANQSMGGFRLINLGAPVLGTDAANKTYVDTRPEIFAATRVVDPLGGGTDLTIAAAIAALPATGGTIFIKEGTYAITSTLSLPDKPIVFRGAGAEATIIDIGSNTIAAFTIGFDRPYTFEHLSIRGDGSAGQSAWRFTFTTTGQETIEIRHVNVGRRLPSIAFPIEVTFDSFGTGAVPNISVEDCQFIMPSMATARLLRGPAKIDIEFSSSFEASSLFGGIDDATGATVFQCRACTFSGSSWGTIKRIDAFGCSFLGDGGITVGEVGRFFDCDTVATTTGPARWIDFLTGSSSNRVIGNRFGTFTAEAIRLDCVNSLIIGNENCLVTEVGASNNNRYSDNIGFDGSVIIGADCVVDGVRRKDVTGAVTVDALTLVFTHHNHKGLGGSGTIKNTGGVNSLTVRRTATDAFGVTDFVETLVLPGASFSWSMESIVNTAVPPYTSYAVSVRSTVPGSPTTYSLRHASMGAR